MGKEDEQLSHSDPISSSLPSKYNQFARPLQNEAKRKSFFRRSVQQFDASLPSPSLKTKSSNTANDASDTTKEDEVKSLTNQDEILPQQSHQLPETTFAATSIGKNTSTASSNDSSLIGSSRNSEHGITTAITTSLLAQDTLTLTRTSSVSLESLRRHRTSTVGNSGRSNHNGSNNNQKSSGNSGSSFSSDVTLNFERVQTKFFFAGPNDDSGIHAKHLDLMDDTDEEDENDSHEGYTNSSIKNRNPSDRLWEAFQRVVLRCSGKLPKETGINASSANDGKDHPSNDALNGSFELVPDLENGDGKESNFVVPAVMNIPKQKKTNENVVESVFIHGQSGVGKTHLFEIFKQRVEQQQQENKMSLPKDIRDQDIATVCFLESNFSPHKSTRSSNSTCLAGHSTASIRESSASTRSTVTEPFVAFKEIFRQIVEFLLSQEEDVNNDSISLEQVSKILQDHLGGTSATSQDSVVQYLIHLIPNFKRVLDYKKSLEQTRPKQLRGDENDSFSKNLHSGLLSTQKDDVLDSFSSIRQKASSEDNTAAMKQFGLFFVRILRIIGKALKAIPIVMFIDDLQWADPDSLDLISTLVAEKDIGNLMLISAFREEQELHSQEHGITRLVDQRVSDKLTVHSILWRKILMKKAPNSSSRQAMLSLATRPTLSRARSWTNLRSLTTFGRTQNRRVENNIQGNCDDSNSEADPVPVTYLRKAKTLGSYTPTRDFPSARNDQFRPRHTMTLDYLNSNESLPDKLLEKPSKPNKSPRTLSLIDDDESDENESVDGDPAPLAGTIPRVPRPVPFARKTFAEPDRFSPPPPINESEIPYDTQLPASHWGKLQNGNNDNAFSASHSAASLNLWPPEGHQTPLTRLKSHSPGLSSGTLKLRLHGSGQARCVTDTIPTARREDDTASQPIDELREATSVPAVGGHIRHLNHRPRIFHQASSRSRLNSVTDAPSTRRIASIASTLFGKLSKAPFGQMSLFSRVSSSRAGSIEGSESTCVGLDLLPSTEQPTNVFNLTDILLRNWGVETVCEYISCLLNLETRDCEDLATVVHRKTHGNPTSVMRFIKFLKQDGLLFFSVKTFRWDWDADHINATTMVTNDVGELLAARVKFLPKETLALLKMAACLGNNFHKVVLRHIAEDEGLFNDSLSSVEMSKDALDVAYENRLSEILDDCCEAGLIEEGEESLYWFTHDLVQQNLYSQISEGSVLRQMHLRAARAIQNCGSKPLFGSKNTDFFIAVNHFNMANVVTKDDNGRVELIELNLQASALAREKGSFRAAAVFLERAIAALNGREDWLNTYALTLEAFSAAAEVELSCGNLERSTRYADEVIRHARTIDDRLRGHFVKINVLATQRHFSAALNESFNMLEILGCRIPKNLKWFHLYRDLAKIRKQINGKTIADFLAMKHMTCVLKVSTLRILDTMTLLYGLKGDDRMASLVLTKTMLVTLEHGLSVYAPYSFASFGMLLVYLGDFEGGYQYGILALKLAERFGSKKALSRAAFIFFTFLSWTRQPLVDGIEPMLNSHRMGLQIGDLEYSSMCLCTYSNLYIAVGLPLSPYVEDMSRFIEQLELYNQNQSVALMVSFYQLALNLTGKSNSMLSGFRFGDDGEAMQLETFCLRFLAVGDEHDQGITFLNLKYVTLLLAYIAQEVDEMKNWFRVRKTIKGVITHSHFANLYMTLFSGLSAFSVYRATGKRMYFRKARSSLSALKALSKKGGINVIPLYRLLLAEKQTFDKKKNARTMFDDAIASFARFGLLHMEAIACERAGDYMSSLGDSFWSQNYYGRSMERYFEWGATAKAEHLKYAAKLDERNVKDDVVLISLRGKQRYDPTMWQSIEQEDIIDSLSGSRKLTVAVTP